MTQIIPTLERRKGVGVVRPKVGQIVVISVEIVVGVLLAYKRLYATSIYHVVNAHFRLLEFAFAEHLNNDAFNIINHHYFIVRANFH